MKTIIMTVLLATTTASAQLHLNAGVVDIQNRRDGTTLTWDMGYTHFWDNGLGAGLNHRHTLVTGDAYYTIELMAKYRIGESSYRFDVGLGSGWNLDDHDVHPIVGVRNSFRIMEDVWLNVDLDNSYRNSKDWNGGGWRLETYLKLGLSFDMDKWSWFWKKLRKYTSHRFF